MPTFNLRYILSFLGAQKACLDDTYLAIKQLLQHTGHSQAPIMQVQYSLH